MIQTPTKKYNYCINFIKGIACILVVLMHCEFPGLLGIIIQCISRFCVPFFFMVSGYFCFYEKKRSIVPKLKHIGKIILGSSIMYICIAIFRGNINVSAKALINFVVFNEPVVITGQMWFLFALLYVYIMYGIIDCFSWHKLAYCAIPVLMIAYVFLAQGAHLLGIEVPNRIYRNFLIEGFPMFMLGHWIHKNESSLEFKNRTLINAIIASTILCLCERTLLGRDFGVNICTFPQVIAIFIYGVKNQEKFKKNIIQTLGEKYSMLVYIFHPAVWQGLGIVYNKINVVENTLALYMMPIFVVLTSILFSIIFYEIIKICKQKFLFKY